MSEEQNNDEPSSIKRPTILNIVLSTLAAFIGVQSDKNRKKDFSQKSFIPFFIAGVILITIFYLILVFVAKNISP